MDRGGVCARLDLFRCGQLDGHNDEPLRRQARQGAAPVSVLNSKLTSLPSFFPNHYDALIGCFALGIRSAHGPRGGNPRRSFPGDSAFGARTGARDRAPPVVSGCFDSRGQHRLHDPGHPLSPLEVQFRSPEAIRAVEPVSSRALRLWYPLSPLQFQSRSRSAVTASSEFQVQILRHRWVAVRQ